MAKKHRARRRFSIRRRFGISRRPKNIALGPTLGVGVALIAPAVYAWNNGGQVNMKDFAVQYFRGLSVNATAYDPVTNQWYTGGLKNFYGPIAVGTVAHILANRSGLNRILARNRFGIVI